MTYLLFLRAKANSQFRSITLLKFSPDKPCGQTRLSPDEKDSGVTKSSIEKILSSDCKSRLQDKSEPQLDVISIL